MRLPKPFPAQVVALEGAEQSVADDIISLSMHKVTE